MSSLFAGRVVEGLTVASAVQVCPGHAAHGREISFMNEAMIRMQCKCAKGYEKLSGVQRYFEVMCKTDYDAQVEGVLQEMCVILEN